MFDAVCAGHICLDMTPELNDSFEELFSPGKLSVAGKLTMSTGGSVANTGISLIKLGVETALMAKLGDDALGRMTADLIRALGGSSAHLSVDPDCASAYSVVLAPLNCDRIFLHQPAANDMFSMEDIDFSVVADARVFHFGYPTLMAGIAKNDGEELVRIFQRVREMGVTTSLDVSFPFDRTLDWGKVLENVLPYADLFFPSIEELIMMLEPEKYKRLKALDDDLLKVLDMDELPEMGERLLKMGAKIAAIKCGTKGFYLRTGSKADIAPLLKCGIDAEAWADKEVFSEIYRVKNVASTAGAGDASIAGFLAAMLKGWTPKAAVNAACAAGALCVTDFTATGALMPLEEACRYAEEEFPRATE